MPRRRYPPASIRSRRRRYESYKLLAIDDGSTDESPAIVQARARRDSRIRLLQPGRVGLVGALNLGLRMSRAPLIARMDADDLMHPERLMAQYEFLEQRPEIALVGSRGSLFPPESITAGYREYIRWQNEVLTPDDVAAQIYVESPFAHPSVLFRRATILAVGGCRDGPFPEDYDLWLRLYQGGARIAKLAQVLLHWRERPERASRVEPRYRREAFDQLRAWYLARDRRVRAARAIVIWGAGRKTRQRTRWLRAQGTQPHAWIDVDPRKIGATIWGLPVHAPDWLDRWPRPLVLVYVRTHGAR